MPFFQPARPAYQENPYPFLHRLREEEPVHRSRELGAWVVTSYFEALRALTDDERFSPDPAHAAGELGDLVRRQRGSVLLGAVPILGNSDPPAHTRLRSIVNRAFTPRTVAEFRPEIDAMASDLLRGWRPGEPFEVVRGLAQPLAVTAVLAFLGVPPEELGLVRELSAAIMAVRSGEATGETAWRAAERARVDLELYLRSERPGGVIGVLMEAEAAGQATFDELIMLLIHISLAGNAPTSFAIGNALLTFAMHPGEFARLRAEPDLLPQAVEECLRFDTPTHIVHRFVTAPVDLAGRKLRAGDTVALVLGAANRDPAKFSDPDVFDIGRDATGQLAFGHGIHFCLGAPLARLEIAAMLDAVRMRFGRLNVVPGGLERGDTFLLRGPRLLALVGEPLEQTGK